VRHVQAASYFRDAALEQDKSPPEPAAHFGLKRRAFG
jgi:hypothetical protein